MKAENYRKLVFGGAIAGLGAWVGLAHLLPGTGPAEVWAKSTEPQEIGETLAALSESMPSASQTMADEQPAAAAVAWPADPFFRSGAWSQYDRQTQAQPSELSGGQPGFVLNAVLSGTKPLAIINGLVVTVGDRLADGSVITALDSRSVTLQGPQGTWTLELAK